MPQLSPEQAIEIGLNHHRAGNLREAEAIYRKVLAAAPEHPAALHWLGVIARQTGHPDDEMQLLRRSIELNPNDATTRQDMGEALAARGMLAEAEQHYRAAATLNPDSPAIINDLSVVCHKQRRYAQALELVEQAIRLQPDLPQAHSNRGMSLTDLGRLDDAVRAFDESLRLRPDHTPTLLGKTRALFMAGQLLEAFTLYETRFRNPEVFYPKLTEPRWDGSDPAGRTILVVAEQGVGDTIQFVRYLPLLAARGANVILLCLPSCKTLSETIPGGIRVIASGEARPAFDAHVPVLSLPRIFGTTLQTIPAEVPYLAADSQRVARWRERIGGDGGRLKIGLAWAGSPSHTSDRFRSMPLAQFAPLASVKDVAWFSLQKGPGAEQLANLPPDMTIVDLASDFTDYADTAAAVAALDLVITVDTSVAHVAGALARPVWTLLSYEGEWRWLSRDRTDTPWYPTMRLFRQPEPGDWAAPVETIARALASIRPQPS
jgi:Flp pilus assembly protein TadD